MKSLTFVASFLIAALCAQAETSYFVKPVISVMTSNLENYSSAGAIGFCTGVYFWGQTEHEVSLQVDSVSWDGSHTASYGYTEKFSEDFRPVVLQYRYHANVSPELNFYFGPNAGLMYSKGKLKSGYGYLDGKSCTDLNPTAGASMGIQYRITKHIDADLGYRYIYIKGSTYHMGGYTFVDDSSYANDFYASIGYRF